MVPDTRLRFDAMIRALKTIILPAIPADNKAAIEQASLLIGTLGVMETQIPYAHAFEVAEVRALASFIDVLVRLIDAEAASVLAPAGERISHVQAQARNRAADPMSATSDVQADSRILRAEIDTLIGVADRLDGPMFAAVAAAVVDFEEGHLARERAWVSATGFDVFPETLPTIADALATAKREQAA